MFIGSDGASTENPHGPEGESLVEVYWAICNAPGADLNCLWKEPFPNQYVATCAAVWHVYEEHPDKWVEAVGVRPPKDPCPWLGRYPDGSSRPLTEMISNILNVASLMAFHTGMDKGWYEGYAEPSERPLNEQLLLIHTEISEAVEELREGRSPTEIRYVAKDLNNSGVVWQEVTGGFLVEGVFIERGDIESLLKAGVALSPEGFPIELADIIIRIMDLCGAHGIDLGAAVVEKMGYNSFRPHRHGGKKF